MPKALAPEPWMPLGEEARPRPASAAEPPKPLQTCSFLSHVLPSVAFPSPRCCGIVSLTQPFPTGNSNPGLKHLRVATLIPQTALSPLRTVSRRRQSIDDEITAGISALRGADGLSPPQCGSLQGDKASALSPRRALLAGARGLPLPLPPCPALPLAAGVARPPVGDGSSPGTAKAGTAIAGATARSPEGTSGLHVGACESGLSLWRAAGLKPEGFFPPSSSLFCRTCA